MFPISLTLYSTHQKYNLTAEQLPSTPDRLLFKIQGKSRFAIISKDLSINNMPWFLKEGDFGESISTADKMDLVRQCGAEVDRWMAGNSG